MVPTLFFTWDDLGGDRGAGGKKRWMVTPQEVAGNVQLVASFPKIPW